MGIEILFGVVAVALISFRCLAVLIGKDKRKEAIRASS